VRLARNVAGVPFISRASKDQQAALVNRTDEVVRQCGALRGGTLLRCSELTVLERQVLLERFLISRELANGNGEQAVFISNDESVGVMVNEEDHLRLQALGAGFQLDEMRRLVDELDSEMSRHVNFAFSDKFGYLTACPTNLGTALRASVLLHLPGLVLTQQVGEALTVAVEARLNLRGWHGEGTEAVGDFLQVSNQITLGVPEEQLVLQISADAEKVIAKEQQARERLMTKDRLRMEDRVAKALGILSKARMLALEEALRELSYIRLAAFAGLVDKEQAATVNSLLVLTKPAHIRLSADATLSDVEVDVRRAELVRTNLHLH